jgi:hypothetical protein
MSDNKIYDPSVDKDVPTPVRINAVQYYMDKEPAIKEKLGTTVVGVKKRTGEVVKFPLEVFNVACKLHKDGKDALEIGKSEILLAAREVLGLGPAATTATAKSVTMSATGTKVTRQTVHAMLKLAIGLVSGLETKAVKGTEIAKDIKVLLSELGFEGDVEMTPVVPYSLMLSASQLVALDPELGKHQPLVVAIVKKLQKITVEI